MRAESSSTYPTFCVGDRVVCRTRPTYAADLLTVGKCYTVTQVDGVYLELEGVPEAHFSSDHFGHYCEEVCFG